MSIDHGNCEAELCWYRGNQDRLNEYEVSEERHCVSNERQVDEHGWDISDKKPPFEFTLCSVCWDNSPLRSKGTCVECKCIMIDDPMECGGRLYCRRCLGVDAIVALISRWMYVSIKSCRESYPKTWSEWRTKTNLDADDHQLLCASLEGRRQRRKGVFQRKRKRQNKTIEGVNRLVPRLSDAACQNLVKRHRIDQVPPDVETLVERMATSGY